MAIVEFYQDESDKKEWRWRVKAANGLIIGASTEGYGSREKASNNLRSFPNYTRDVDIKTASDAPDPRPEGSQLPLEFYKDKASEWRWRITARNGQIVHAATEGYQSKESARLNVEALGDAVSSWMSS